MENKSLPLELKDLSREKRTAVIAHAVYTNIDRTDDISTKGMFKSSWERKDNIDFLFNHKDDEIVGKVKSTFEDEEKAYTEVKFGNWKLGDDVLEMADAGVLRGASFGYETEKKEYKTINGRKIRVLKQVKHIETSLLTKMPANPLAGIIQLNKSFTGIELKTLSDDEISLLKRLANNDNDAMQMMVSLSNTLEPRSDLFEWVVYQISRRADMMSSVRSQLKYNSGELKELQNHVERMENFCKNSKASDECIQSVLKDINETKSLLSGYDTAPTPLATDGGVSVGDNGLLKQLLLLNAKMN